METSNISYEVIFDLYIHKNLTADKIAEIFNISSATVRRICKRYNLRKCIVTKPRRKSTFVPASTQYTKISREDLVELFINQNLSTKEVSEKLGFSDCVIKRAIKYNNIKKSNELKTEKRKKSIKEKYGVEYYSQHPKFKEKIEATHLKNCGYRSNFQDPISKEKAKQTMLKRYGVANSRQSKEVQEKAKQTCLERYGVENPKQNKEIQEKIKETTLKRYGVDSFSKTTEFKEKIENTHLKNCGYKSNFQDPAFIKKAKQTCLEKYGYEYAMQNEQIKEKNYLSKKKNHNVAASSEEEKIFDLLKEKFTDVKRQFRDNIRYPFACDFYIPEQDLFIEYQGHWNHGLGDCHEPFDKNNKKHLEKVKFLESRHKKSYQCAIQVWTIRDPLKRETAKKNNLNWIEFFDMKSFLEWYDKC